MFSQTAEYALRAVVHLASLQAAGDTVSQTTQQIADSTCVPVDYLSKILQSLGRGGLVVVQRGPGGGYQLARPATKITLYDVVQAVDVLPRIHHCPLGLKSHATHLCPLHKRMDETMEVAEKTLRDTTIATMLDGTPIFAAAEKHPGQNRSKQKRGRTSGPRSVSRSTNC